VTQIRTVLAATGHLGDSTRELLDALLRLWRAVNRLAQRHEHGGRRGEDSLSSEDARRLRFHVMLVMHEFDRALEA
jgi:hypothetical protein